MLRAAEAADTSVLRCWHTWARGLAGARDGAAQRKSEPRKDASSERSNAREVTRTTSVRGGAVSLPDAIIPETCPANGVELGLAGLFFLSLSLLKTW